MSVLKRFFGMKPSTLPALEVMSALSHQIVERATRGAIDCVAALRGGGDVVAPEDTQRILDEFVFVQMHFVDRAANAMLTRPTQALFLPPFVMSTLWLRYKTQDPSMADEDAERRAHGVLADFDEANSAYAQSSLERPDDAEALQGHVSFVFGVRVARAARVPATGRSLATCMSGLEGVCGALRAEERLAQLVQLTA